jgi:hypothetical protein
MTLFSQYTTKQVLFICSGTGPAGKVLRSRFHGGTISISVSIAAAGYSTDFLYLFILQDRWTQPCTHRIFVRWASYAPHHGFTRARKEAAEGTWN